MKHILVIGAGKSSSSLIQYLKNLIIKENWFLTICDQNTNLAEQILADTNSCETLAINALDRDIRLPLIRKADLVISMLPARFHIQIAEDCISEKTHLITPSYVSDEMQNLHDTAKKNGLIFLNEIGVDPGIDHMSAMKVLDEIREKGGEMKIFESFTGGLIAPKSDNNPWNYKFTWNPRNVVLAGQGEISCFIQEHRHKYIPYNKLFRRTEVVDIENFGKFEGYANRDSLHYKSLYQLDNIPTIYRGTLRRLGFCRAWDCFVQLGATSDEYKMANSHLLTKRQFINSFLPYNPHDSVELKLRYYLNIRQDDPIWAKLVWLGIFDNEVIGLENASPAQLLQKILEDKWTLEPNDKDMIVMWHKFGYSLNGKDHEINASMVTLGEDQMFTAMAKTVGLPIGIAAKLILNKVIKTPGVQVPVSKEIYTPMLLELSENGIVFNEYEVEPKFY